MLLEIRPPWASSLSVQDCDNMVRHLIDDCQLLAAPLQPLSLAWVPEMDLIPQLNFVDCCQTSPIAPKSLSFLSLPTPVVALLFLSCVFFFFPLLNNSANRLALECSRAVCSLMREAACQLFYLSSHLTANPTSLTNHHGIAVETQN